MAERGVIKNVTSFCLEITMPDGNAGYVHMTDVVDWPNDRKQRDRRFQVGDSLLVEVVRNDGVALGLRPVVVDPPPARSLEDKPSAPDLVAAVSEPLADPSPAEEDLPADDPDPFRESPLDPAERRAMLEKLAEHMRPSIEAAGGAERTELRALWNDLRRQTTINGFRDRAEQLLTTLDASETGNRS